MSNMPYRDLTSIYKGKTVIVTGHTGFKGAWLCEWLLMLGARVVGISLSPDTKPSLFELLGLENRVKHHIIDIRDRAALAPAILEESPDFLFHLAAQPLVRLSYQEPVETYETNVMGTVHLLDVLRQLQSSYQSGGTHCAALFVTTDKCYENREWLNAYREDDAMGGYDPYSSSKGAAELAISSFRNSFFNTGDVESDIRVGVSSARAGNVIGGGDWALDRIIPDCMRCLQNGTEIRVRNPHATRPWQHVLEPLYGYLQLAANQYRALQLRDYALIQATCSSFNFGPSLTSNQNVKTLVTEVLKHWQGRWIDESDMETPHEAGRLNLAWDKAFHMLGWQPRWNFEETIKRTVNWYREHAQGDTDVSSLIENDISAYIDALSG